MKYNYATAQFCHDDGTLLSSNELARLYREYMAQDKFALFTYFEKVFKV